MEEIITGKSRAQGCGMEADNGFWTCVVSASWLETFRNFGSWLLTLPWLEFVKTLVDLLKGVAWPLAVIGVALLFRNEIKELLPNTTEAGPTGFKFRDGARTQATATKTSIESGTVELKELPGFARSPAMEKLERELHADLIKKIEPDKQVDVLVRLLAEARMMFRFERIYGLIYGSQILALRRINAAGAVRRKDLEDFFFQVKEAHPEFYTDDKDFERWLGFMVGQEVLAEDGDLFSVSNFGVDFLQYLTNQKLPENKQF